LQKLLLHRAIGNQRMVVQAARELRRWLRETFDNRQGGKMDKITFRSSVHRRPLIQFSYT